MIKAQYKNMKSVFKFLPLIFCISCSGAQTGDGDAPQTLVNDDITKVKTEVLTQKDFENEIVCNGKIAAGKYADIYWKVSGVISKIYVRNGEKIRHGETLAEIENFKLKNSYEASSAALKQAELNMQEVIIAQGYDVRDSNVPENVKRLAEIKSGYLQQLASYNLSKYEYENSKLIAPFSGIVANIEDNESNPTTSKPFCRIIDGNNMKISFNILESELDFVSSGSKAEVFVFSKPGRSWKAKISEINPSVEKNGMVKVSADILDPAGLYEGMNAEIKIRRSAGSFLAVKKSAVVTRSDRKVVFTSKNGLAHWNYIETAAENSTEYAVKSGLQAGDSVIIEGNTFLADKTKIKAEN
jgi:RND family efflux transporter MFP subunit